MNEYDHTKNSLFAINDQSDILSDCNSEDICATNSASDDKDLCAAYSNKISQLITDHIPAIRRICAKFFKNNPHDIDDVTNDIVVKLLTYCMNSKNTLNNILNISAWINSYSRNHCIDYIRSKNRESKIISFVDDIASLSDANITINNEHFNESIYDQRRTIHIILDELCSLPNLQRNAVQLRLIHDYSYEYIAIKLNIRPDLARKYIQRFRRKIQKIIEAKDKK